MNRRALVQFFIYIILAAHCSSAHAALKIRAGAKRLTCSARLHTAATRLHLTPVSQNAKAFQPVPELSDRYTPHYQAQKEHYYKTLQTKPWALVAREHIDRFAQRDAQIKQAFKEYAQDPHYDEEYQRLLFQATIMQRNMTLLKISAERVQGQTIAPVITDGIRQVLRDTQCDTTPIAIVPNPYVASMGTDHSTIYVGKQLLHAPAILALRGFDLARIKAMALHEVQHLLHDDAFDRAFYCNLFPVAFELHQKLNTLQEERADVLSGLSSPECARALAGYHTACASPLDKLRLLVRNDARAFRGKENFFGEPHPLARAERLESLAEEMEKSPTSNL